MEDGKDEVLWVKERMQCGRRGMRERGKGNV